MDKPEAVAISVSSVCFETNKVTLNAFSGTILSTLDKSSEYFDETRTVYAFDRDPELFRHILNAYRIQEVHIPRTVCPMVFKKELEFWKIPLTLIEPCCWKYLYKTESNIDDLKVVIKEDYDMQMNAHNQVSPVQSTSNLEYQHVDKTESRNGKNVANEVLQGQAGLVRKSRVKQEEERPMSKTRNVSKLWLLLEEPSSSFVAKVWYYFYICVVLVSVVLFVIWLDPSVRVPRYLHPLSESSVDILNVNSTTYRTFLERYNKKMLMAGGTDPHPAMFAVDALCLIFFILETILTICVCPDRKKYFFDLYNLLKIVICVSMSTTFLLEFNKDILKQNKRIAHFMVSCRALNVLRLLLIFRLRKIYNSLHIMLLALRHSLKELLLLLFTFIVLVIIYGCLVFSAEIESDMFPSSTLSMWWAVVTMTTVGYGDFYPISPLGYVVGVVCALNGIIVLALPIAAIAGTFSNLFARNAELQKHKQAIKDQKARKV